MPASPESWGEERRAWERLWLWLGLGEPDRRGIDALDGLSDIGRLRDLLDKAEAAAVRDARRRGSSWAEIGERLGVTRQSAWERWRDLDEAPEIAVNRVLADAAAELAAEAVKNRRHSTVRVPDVVGQTFSQARKVLMGKGLVALGPDPEDAALTASEWASAAVTDQSPEAGAKVPKGGRVTLWLGRGGTAGDREPRCPTPGPRSLRAARDEPSGDR
jgi:hypothetical protein